MKTLGLVMAKSHSSRLANKNIRSICDKPAIAYPIDILRHSGVCDKIVVSTDSEDYKQIALEHGADDVVMRHRWWSHKDGMLETFGFEVQKSVETYQEESGEKFDVVAFIGGNDIFVRPSWIRVAVQLITGYLYNDMPIDLVANDSLCIPPSVYKTSPLATEQNIFTLMHSGIRCDIDWLDEFIMAEQIMEAIRKGDIHYPMEETVHDECLEKLGASKKGWQGLTRINK